MAPILSGNRCQCGSVCSQRFVLPSTPSAPSDTAPRPAGIASTSAGNEHLFDAKYGQVVAVVADILVDGSSSKRAHTMSQNSGRALRRSCGFGHAPPRNCGICAVKCGSWAKASPGAGVPKHWKILRTASISALALSKKCLII